jgi:hypothetical protein
VESSHSQIRLAQDGEYFDGHGSFRIEKLPSASSSTRATGPPDDEGSPRTTLYSAGRDDAGT